MMPSIADRTETTTLEQICRESSMRSLPSRPPSAATCWAQAPRHRFRRDFPSHSWAEGRCRFSFSPRHKRSEAVAEQSASTPIADRIGCAQWQSRPQSRRRTIQQGRFKWQWRPRNRGSRRRHNGLFKFRGWRLRRRCGLLRNFFHSIPTARARRNLSIRNQRLALFQRYPVSSPIHLVTDAIRDISRSASTRRTMRACS